MGATALTLQPLREIRLYGHLGREFGRVHRLAVDSAAEAVRALMVLFPRFRQAVLHEREYRVLLGRGEQRRSVGEPELTIGLGRTDCVRIVPVVHGAKRQGLGQTILGVVLVVVGAVLTAFGYGAVGGPLAQMGWSMIIGGVIQMLSPQRNNSSGDKKSEASYATDGPVNVTEQGGPVPLIIGRVICGSVVVSSGLHADDISPAPAPNVPLPDLPYYSGRFPGYRPGETPVPGHAGDDPFGHPAEIAGG